MTCPHPFFDVNTAWRNFYLLNVVRLRWRLDLILGKVRLEVLKQGNFFLQLFRVLIKTVSWHDILFLSGRHGSPLIIVEHYVILCHHNFSAIVEKYTGGIIWQQVPQPILGWVINPFGDPDRLHRLSTLWSLNGVRTCLPLTLKRQCLWALAFARHWSLHIVRCWSLEFDDLMSTTGSDLHLRQLLGGALRWFQSVHFVALKWLGLGWLVRWRCT